MKKFITIIFIIVLITVCGACGKEETTKSPEHKIVLINPTGPLVIPAIALTKNELVTDPEIEVRYWKNNDEIAAALANGDADFAVLPITTAANLYAQQKNLTLLGVHEWKIFYMIASDASSFTDWQSLKGKEIYTPPGRGNTIDVLLRIAISAAGLIPDVDVKINYAAPQEIVALYQSGKIDYAALPEPFISAGLTARGEIVVDFQDYWRELTGGENRLPVAGLFVTSSFLDLYPETTEAVSSYFADSVQWSEDNSDLAISLSESDLGVPAPIISAALERIDFYYVPIKECKEEVRNYLQLMQEQYPEGITALPDDNFYNEL